MKDYAQKTTQRQETGNGFVFHALKWVLIVAIIFLVLDLISKPVRASWSNDYLARGDTYLDQKKYLSAELQYQKALFLNSDNAEAQSQLDLANRAEADISLLVSYFNDRKIQTEQDAFAKAKIVPKNPADAVKISKDLISAGEYQLAIIPAKTATGMDANYQSGWEYLAIANLYASQKVEISTDAKQKYLDAVSVAKSHLKKLPGILK